MCKKPEFGNVIRHKLMDKVLWFDVSFKYFLRILDTLTDNQMKIHLFFFRVPNFEFCRLDKLKPFYEYTSKFILQFLCSKVLEEIIAVSISPLPYMVVASLGTGHFTSFFEMSWLRNNVAVSVKCFPSNQRPWQPILYPSLLFWLRC